MLQKTSQGNFASRVHRLLSSLYCSLTLEVALVDKKRPNEVLVALIQSRPALFLCYTWACSLTTALRSTTESSIYCLYEALGPTHILDSNVKLSSTLTLLQGSLACKLKQLLVLAGQEDLDPASIEMLWKALLLSCPKESGSSLAIDADTIHAALFQYFSDFRSVSSDIKMVQVVRTITRAVYLNIPRDPNYLIRWWSLALVDVLKVYRLSDQKYKVVIGV